VFVERLWRSVKYEEVYLHAYETPKEVNAALTRYFRSASTTRITRFPEVRERALRLVFKHQGEHASQWAAIGSISEKMGRQRDANRAAPHRCT
jgi:hypothetical protein